MKNIFSALALIAPLSVMAKPITEITIPAEQNQLGHALHATLSMTSNNEIEMTTDDGHLQRTPCAAFAKSVLNYNQSVSISIEILESQPALRYSAQGMRKILEAGIKALDACQATSTPAPISEYNQARNETATLRKRIDALKP